MVSQWPREGRHRRGFRREFFFGDDKLYACVCLQEKLKSLWQDIGIPDLAEGEWSRFRVGKFEDGRKRPVIVKFAHIGRKFKILLKAKNFMGKASLVVIT